METFKLKNGAPHQDIDVLVNGEESKPKRALILIHGRYASAANIMSLADELAIHEETVILAPEAADNQWYPLRFIEPRDSNQPHLDSSLAAIEELISYSLTKYGLDPERIVLAGFSQGACLVADYVARTPRQYGGVCIFSGGLIGNDTEINSKNWEGSLDSTPIYIGSDRNDSHIPIERVHLTTSVLRRLNADVNESVYDGLGHSIHNEGIEFLSRLLQRN